jgi:hypothetical protein
VWQFEALEERSDGAYFRAAAQSTCAANQALSVSYQLFKNQDASHRLIVAGTLAGAPLAAVLSPGESATLATPRDAQSAALPASGWATLAQFFPEGVKHILGGADHLAFLLALLLPIYLFNHRRTTHDRAATRYSDSSSAAPPVVDTRASLIALVRTITGFTLGHSATLILANLGVINAASSWVEPAIAFSIAATALHNLYPVRFVRGDMLALGFGLIHGLGFSSVMTDAGVTGTPLLWGLAGFNLGVEAGQLAVVALWCVLHWAASRWSRYNAVVVRGGSYALIGVALYWMVQRV